MKPIMKFNEEKAIAALSYYLELSGGKADKYWLNKVMYYSEREYLIRTGQPLFFDDLYSMPFGPVVSNINDGIDMTLYENETNWNNYFQLKNKTLLLKTSADYDVFSEFELAMLQELFSKFEGWSFDQLKKFFHDLPEYRETQSRISIQPEEILKGNGYNKIEIQEALNEIAYFNQLKGALNCVE